MACLTPITLLGPNANHKKLPSFLKEGKKSGSCRIEGRFLALLNTVKEGGHLPYNLVLTPPFLTGFSVMAGVQGNNK